MSTMDFFTAEEVLGLSGVYDEAEIKRAYRAAALHIHPDMNDGSDAATARMQDVNVAYDYLTKDREGMRQWSREMSLRRSGRTSERPAKPEPRASAASSSAGDAAANEAGEEAEASGSSAASETYAEAYSEPAYSEQPTWEERNAEHEEHWQETRKQWVFDGTGVTRAGVFWFWLACVISMFLTFGEGDPNSLIYDILLGTMFAISVGIVLLISSAIVKRVCKKRESPLLGGYAVFARIAFLFGPAVLAAVFFLVYLRG